MDIKFIWFTFAVIFILCGLLNMSSSLNTSFIKFRNENMGVKTNITSNTLGRIRLVGYIFIGIGIVCGIVGLAS